MSGTVTVPIEDWREVIATLRAIAENVIGKDPHFPHEIATRVIDALDKAELVSMTGPTREEVLEQVARDLLDALQTLVGDKHPGLLFSDRMITARKAIDDAKVKL